MTTPSIDELAKAAVEWRCFHCDEVFTEPEAAQDHFGDMTDQPACQLNALEGGILALYREAQRELHTWRVEDNASAREFYALGAKHHTALRDAEQAGYDKGLADSRALSSRVEKAEARITEPEDVIRYVYPALLVLHTVLKRAVPGSEKRAREMQIEMERVMPELPALSALRSPARNLIPGDKP
jgi:hypothetical protein